MATRHHSAYDPQRDYREYEVSGDDAPFQTTRAAARRLGYQQTESVRRLVLEGRIPARRTGSNYNARIEIPEWALRGWMIYKGIPEPDQPIEAAPVESNARVRELEDALLVLRQAGEHERKARQLLEEALMESGRAYDLLKDALGSVVIPSSPG